MLKGLSTDGAAVGKKLLTDGAEGYTLTTDAAHSAMYITNNLANFAVTAATDGTLATNSDFVTLTGASAPWTSATLYGNTFSTDSMAVPVAGVYRLVAWVGISTFPASTAKVAMRYKLNGSTFSGRRVIAKSGGVGDIGHLQIDELITLTAGSYIQIAVASTDTGNLVVNDACVSLELVRQTA